jgi:hypothetical protein
VDRRTRFPPNPKGKTVAVNTKNWQELKKPDMIEEVRREPSDEGQLRR